MSTLKFISVFFGLVLLVSAAAPTHASPGDCYAARAEAARRATYLQICWARYGTGAPICQPALNALAVAVARRKSMCGG